MRKILCILMAIIMLSGCAVSDYLKGELPENQEPYSLLEENNEEVEDEIDALIKELTEEEPVDDAGQDRAKDIMEDSPPTITKDASMTVVSDLLKAYPIIVVVEKGKIIGVVTKADILKKVYKTGLFS